MGAWTYVEPRLRELLQGQGDRIEHPLPLRYAGRPERASPPRDRSTGTEPSKRASSRPRWWMPHRLRWRRMGRRGEKTNGAARNGARTKATRTKAG